MRKHVKRINNKWKFKRWKCKRKFASKKLKD